MDKQPAKPPQVARPVVTMLKIGPLPPGGQRRRIVTDGQAGAPGRARRKWLMISGAVLAALAAGVLIGRFLLP